MPAYPWLLTDDLDTSQIGNKLDAMRKLGVPYTDEEVSKAQQLVKEQADAIGNNLADSGVEGMHNKEITALIAYLQRLGTDIKE